MKVEPLSPKMSCSLVLSGRSVTGVVTAGAQVAKMILVSIGLHSNLVSYRMVMITNMFIHILVII